MADQSVGFSEVAGGRAAPIIDGVASAPVGAAVAELQGSVAAWWSPGVFRCRQSCRQWSSCSGIVWPAAHPLPPLLLTSDERDKQWTEPDLVVLCSLAR
jgi:hypothetical protein